jgi:hypothetical protein
MIARVLRSVIGRADDVDVQDAPGVDDAETVAAAEALAVAEGALADVDAAITALKADVERAGRDRAAVAADRARLDAEAADLHVSAFRGSDAAAQRLDAIDAELIAFGKKSARIEAVQRDLAAGVAALNEQHAVAALAVKDARLDLFGHQLRQQGARTAKAVDVAVREIERWIECDIAASQAASAARQPQGLHISERLQLALSKHIATEPVLQAAASTRLELSVSNARVRGTGLSFEAVSQRAWMKAAPKPAAPKDDDAVPVVGEVAVDA